MGPRSTLVFFEVSDHCILISVYVIVEVDEEGTEAAAATGMTMTMCSGIVSSDELLTVEFRVNHPFLFANRHGQSGHIVFMGRIAKL